MPANAQANAYAMTGDRGARAVQTGLAVAQWYHSDIPRPQMKAPMARRDGPARHDTAILFGVMALSAIGGVALWGSWAALPFWAVYGVLYRSAMDSRWHECGHGTAFRTARYNDMLYQIASFCMPRNPVVWR